MPVRDRPLVPLNFNILTFPMRYPSWEADREEFWAYTSRLKTLFHERPYVAAAVFSRGVLLGELLVRCLEMRDPSTPCGTPILTRDPPLL